jgi:hypothetical protein
MKKIDLKFMVVPSELEKYARVKNKVRIVIRNPYSKLLDGLLGESGRRLALNGIPFYFTKSIATKLIKSQVATLQ